MSDLLPCPFCDGAMEDRGYGAIHVAGQNCPIGDLAIDPARWNRRAPVPLPVDAPEPTPGQIDLLCLSVQDVINGRLETGDAAADLAAVKEHLDTALKLTGFDEENG